MKELIARHPRQAVWLGKGLLLAGRILGALFARAGYAGPVPEGPVVFAIAAGLVLAGVALVHLGEKAAGK